MKRVLAVAASVLALAGASITPAVAQTNSVLACTWLCFGEHDNFDGDYLMIDINLDGSCRNMPSGWDNKASSAANGSGYWVEFYDRRNCAGSYGYRLAPRSSDEDLTNNGFDNKLSAYRI
ncbi:hypothetical protein DMH04_03355 [Kibdelosporangium aridum]|uniref:Peptidase inhibitor family I36 n=1 Tax=Kibdelosporangium aridum TaxID=2030 RepID=A0A428ZR36_KIBAR|nr:peptidase inhibitor family I36 protein [Kibdelosporangium aridum]RSM90515.1 hypothetical protein DMH04_03355 [Kibdelosporangium aridum]